MPPIPHSPQALIQWDKDHVWHPFTPMRQWTADEHEPLLIERGDGAYLLDSSGRRYLDGNASIWTNIHGHGHPTIMRAIREQAETLAHASALGFATGPAAALARALVACFPVGSLNKVFFTDDGSTAMECAVRMALQYWQMSGHGERARFAAFDRAYHGDTLGAASLGGIPTFHGRLGRLGLAVERVADIEALEALAPAERDTLAGVVIEPLIQGPAGMRLWPQGMLRKLRQWCDRHGCFLILDEVMTGFGRTGTLFACEQEGVVPDFIALAKGLTGGTLPLAATLTTERVYEAFLGEPEEHRTFYYGHSYSGNPLGCAAALASLQVFREERVLEGLPTKIEVLRGLLQEWSEADPRVRDVRQCGMMAGIELGDGEGAPLPPEERTGAKVCLAAREHGLLTRPINDTLVLMPPLCVSEADLRLAVEALRRGTETVIPV